MSLESPYLETTYFIQLMNEIAAVPLATAGAGDLFSDADHSSVFFHWMCLHSIFKGSPSPAVEHLSLLFACVHFQPGASLSCFLYLFAPHLFPLLIHTFRLAESLFWPTSKQSSQLPFESSKPSFVPLMWLSVWSSAHPHLWWLIFFINLKQAKVIWEEGTEIAKCHHQIQL